MSAEHRKIIHNAGEDKTVETRGMVRWTDNDGDQFFIKRTDPDADFFVIGSEWYHDYDTSIAFSNVDAEALIHKIAAFNGFTVTVNKD